MAQVEEAIYKLGGDSSSYVKAANEAAAAGGRLAATNDNITVSQEKMTKMLSSLCIGNCMIGKLLYTIR